MANLNTLFDELKNTVNFDPKLKGLLQGLNENVKGKDDIIVELQNRVPFLENKVMKWKDIAQKIVLFCKIYLYDPEILSKMSWPFLTKLWAWR